MFIEENDYKLVIKDDILQRIIGDYPDIKTEAELHAQTVVESYLRLKFDVTAIFAKTGDDRDRDVLICCLDIALYTLSSRINPNQVPETRDRRYNAAIDWLKNVAKGFISPNLPALPAEEQSSGISIKSYPKQNFDF